MIVDTFDLAFVASVGAVLGSIAHRQWLDHVRRRDSVCPTCLGPLDESGSSEAWGAKLKPAEGRVLLHPDEERRGFLVLDGGRVGEVDVLPAEAMLLADDAPPFVPRDADDEEVE